MYGWIQYTVHTKDSSRDYWDYGELLVHEATNMLNLGGRFSADDQHRPISAETLASTLDARSVSGIISTFKGGTAHACGMGRSRSSTKEHCMSMRRAIGPGTLDGYAEQPLPLKKTVSDV